MTPIVRVGLVWVVILAGAGSAWAQFRIPIRIPVRVPVRVPTKLPVHAPTHVPHLPVPHHLPGSHDADDREKPVPTRPAMAEGEQAAALAKTKSNLMLGGIGVGSLAAVAGGVFWYRRSRGVRIYIVRIPYGEAPEHVRQAWVGLELPVVSDQKRPKMLEAASVRTQQEQESVFGYAVEGKTAIELLENQAPAAAAWWRENVPDVVTPGFRFGFPAGDCRKV